MPLPTAYEVIQNPGSLKELFGMVPSMIGDVVVDVVTSYTPSMDAEITSHPVERGAEITDARVIRPQEIVLDIILTDPDLSAETVVKSAIAGVTGETLTTTWREKRDRLIEIFETGELVTVTTPESEYDDMMVTSIVPVRDADTSNAYFATVALRKVVIVSTQTVTVSASDIPVADAKKQTDSQKNAAKKAQKQGNAGTQQAQSVDREKTSLQSIIDMIAGG